MFNSVVSVIWLVLAIAAFVSDIGAGESPGLAFWATLVMSQVWAAA